MKSIVNHHLLKTKPLYKDQYGRIVKLLVVNKCAGGLLFTTKIVGSDCDWDIGKWSQVYKHELTKV